MRSVLCLFVVCMFATTAAAQFGGKNAPATRPAAPPADTAQKKTTTEKGKAHPGKANAADQVAAETELTDALLVAMDTDHDGIVTKIEYREAMKVLGKVHKDSKGNMTVPDKAAADTTAAPAADAAAAQGAGAPAGDQRNNNEVMARFMDYDANHDGVLSPNEVPAQMRGMLREADVNRDGVIDPAELQAFSRKMGDRMKAFSAGVNPNGAQGNGRPKP
jgi:Ca2+-binding EF-hand superfamily protein